MNRRITEENEESLSLHDNTVLIQNYNDLDYSDEYDEADSSQEHSLSGYQQAELQRAQEISRASKAGYLDHYLHRHTAAHAAHASHASHARGRGRDLESKYDFCISPSTKEEYSLLNPPSRPSLPPRNSVLSSRHRNQHLEMPSLDEEPSERSDSENAEQQRKERRSSRDRGFDINSFLNAHPVPLKNKKGISVLAQSNKPKLHPKPKMPSGGEIREEESIVLMTLPENDSVFSLGYDRKRREEALRKSEEELQQASDLYQVRLKEARLNFINTFTPAPFKPKSSPYNLLKYMLAKHEL